MGEVSDCADGFPTLFHIDRLAGNIGNLDTNDNDRRQVVIPDINFGCNGAITRWIVGAQWEGRNNNNMAFNTELQIWRKINPNQYMKVIGTSVFISGENASQVYEVETLLDFQEGDVLGFFQPRRSSIDILLEDSERLITYYTRPRNNNSPHTGEVFSIDDGDVFDSTRYPLIAVSTGI